MNTALISGNLTRDAGFKKVGDKGTSLCKFSVASNEKQGEKEITEFHNVTVWGYHADACAGLLKGDSVFVEGRIQTRSYEKDGVKKYATDIVANAVYKALTTPKSKPEATEDVPW